MAGRFTIVQGGRAGSAPSVPATLGADRWQVALLRPAVAQEADALHAAIPDWRALVEAAADPDPFADPDYLIAAARLERRRDALAVALVHGITPAGRTILGGVVPLVLTHPVWGGPVRGWQPPLAPRPVEPCFGPGAAGAAIEAVIAHLRTDRPRATLHLAGIAAEGSLLRELRRDDRLRLTELSPERWPPGFGRRRPGGAASEPRCGPGLREEIPARPLPAETEGAILRMRDSVERFLALEAGLSCRPRLADPAEAATIRVVTRLFARRGRAGIGFGAKDGEGERGGEGERDGEGGGTAVAGAIWLGPPGRRRLWLSAGACTDAAPAPPRVDLRVALDPRAGDLAPAPGHDAPAGRRPARIRLVGGG